MNAPSSKKLVEGIDYYLENGKFVFMSRYHRKRGYCCNSRCRHCPYGLGRDDGTGADIVIDLVGLPDLGTGDDDDP